MHLVIPLFNVYSEHIFSEALEIMEVAVKINDKLINIISKIRYADDTVVIADSDEGL